MPNGTATIMAITEGRDSAGKMKARPPKIRWLGSGSQILPVKRLGPFVLKRQEGFPE